MLAAARSLPPAQGRCTAPGLPYPSSEESHDQSRSELLAGRYADSVTLLQVSRTVQGLDGVRPPQVAMATPLNVEVLTEMGFEVARRGGAQRPRSWRCGSTAGRPAGAPGRRRRALKDANRRESDRPELAPPRTYGQRLPPDPDAIALVAARADAFVEAMDAVDAGRDVMVFSDNVPLDQEVALKRAAAERGLLVMGPDCGTAVVGGLGLGFANVVPPGPVGIVAASGTGCQQLLALLDHAGVGVASALGVGGRDLSAEVGGLATREALRRLDDDRAVELIVVVSKPPADDVAAEIEEYAAGFDAGRLRAARRRSARPHRRDRGRCCAARPRGAGLAGDVARHPRNRAGPRPLRRRHPAQRGELIARADRDTFIDFGDDDYTAGGRTR